MYYLRKKPYTKEYTDPITKKIEAVEFNSDRAVFKHKRYSRFYRMNYLCTDSEVKLWKCKSLQRVLRHRVNLFNYCNEWFDIYDDETNEPIEDKLYKLYKPVVLEVTRTTQTLWYDHVTDTLLTTKPKDTCNYKMYRKGTRLYVYNFLDYHRLWEAANPFSENDLSDVVILVTKDGNTLIQFSNWEEYTLNGSPLIKTGWEDCNLDG